MLGLRLEPHLAPLALELRQPPRGGRARHVHPVAGVARDRRHPSFGEEAVETPLTKTRGLGEHHVDPVQEHERVRPRVPHVREG